MKFDKQLKTMFKTSCNKIIIDIVIIYKEMVGISPTRGWASAGDRQMDTSCRESMNIEFI